MGGNSMSALYTPIDNGDVHAVRKVLERYGPVTPLLLKKQFVANLDSCCVDVDPVFCTPMQFCIMKNEPEILRVLLEAGGDPNEKDGSGTTLLHRACKKYAVECVQVLLEFGARVSDCDEWGVYPIHACAGAYGNFQESLEILDMLVKAGNPSDVNLSDAHYGKSVLQYAAYNGNMLMCEKLIELGAEVNHLDKTGRNAYQSAEKYKRIQDYLKANGARLPDQPKTVTPVTRPSHSKIVPHTKAMSDSDYPRQIY